MCLLNDKVQVNILLTKEFEGDCSSYEKKKLLFMNQYQILLVWDKDNILGINHSNI